MFWVVGKTFAQKTLEAKGRSYDREQYELRRAKQRIAELEEQLKKLENRPDQ